MKTEMLNPPNKEQRKNTENQALMCDSSEELKYLGVMFDTADMIEKVESDIDMKKETKNAFRASELSGEIEVKNGEARVNFQTKLSLSVTDENDALESKAKKTVKNKRKQRNENKKDTCDVLMPCEFCSKSFTSAFQLVKHVLDHHASPVKGLKCVLCEKSFTARGLRSHVLRAHMPVPDIPTNMISVSEENKSDDFETFIVSGDGRKAYKCKTCGERFWYIAQATRHVWKHTKVTPYQCSVCGIYQREPGHLKKHMLIHEGKLPQCQICNKQFSSDRTLKNHLSLHTGEKTHRCEICGENFRLRMSLRRHHLNKHPGESSTSKSQCTCPDCGKLFVDGKNLRLHMFTHSDEKQFDCAICGRQFRQPDVRDQHQKKHSDSADADHICVECGDVFKTPRSLKMHREAQHNIEAQHECVTCGKRFKYASALSRHKVLHTGVKRYKCEDCEKPFTTSYSLQCHLRSHAGVKQFACTVCEAKFTQRENLNRHLKRMHLRVDRECTQSSSTAITI